MSDSRSQFDYHCWRTRDEAARKRGLSFAVINGETFVRHGYPGNLGEGSSGISSEFVSEKDHSKKICIKEEKRKDGKYIDAVRFERGAQNFQKIHKFGLISGDLKSDSAPRRTALALIPGVKLSNFDPKNYNYFIELCIAIVECVMDYHRQGLIHTDIFSDNIKINIENGKIVVRLIDLDSSRVIGEAVIKIAPGYNQYAPETASEVKATESIDTYSIGWMLKDYFWKKFPHYKTPADYLLTRLFDRMHAHDPRIRLSLSDVLKRLNVFRELPYIADNLAQLSESHMNNFIRRLGHAEDKSDEKISPELLGAVVNTIPQRLGGFLDWFLGGVVDENIAPSKFEFLEKLLLEKNALDDLLGQLSDLKKQEFLHYFAKKLLQKYGEMHLALQQADRYKDNRFGYESLILAFNKNYQSYLNDRINRIRFHRERESKKLQASQALVNDFGLFKLKQMSSGQFQKQYATGKLGEIAKRAFECAKPKVPR